MSVLESVKVKIIGWTVGTAKATWKEFAIFSYKDKMGFEKKIFINTPSEEQKELLESLDTQMGAEITLITSVEV